MLLVESGAYSARNMGDMAALRVCLDRVASIAGREGVCTWATSPALMGPLVPPCTMADPRGRDEFFERWLAFGGTHKLVPALAKQWLGMAEDRLRVRWSSLMCGWQAMRMQRRGRAPDRMREYHEMMRCADGCVVAGGGFINDHFPEHARLLLLTLANVQRQGLPVVMFSQGIGPLRESSLRKLAAAVLPSCRLIAVRDGSASESVLRELGVSVDLVRHTGDDAVELAYGQRALALARECVGFGVRVSVYSGMDRQTAQAAARATTRFANERGAEVAGVPISFPPRSDDVAAISGLLHLGEHARKALYTLDCPDAIIRQAGRCRVVVTAAYHGAVFALSQGIPVVALVANAYYGQKMGGLQAVFEEGLRVIDVRASDSEAEIHTAIGDAWEAAPHLESPLLASAERQIVQAQRAYTDALASFP